MERTKKQGNWYTEEEKQLAVAYYHATNRSIRRCALGLKLNFSTLNKWIKEITPEKMDFEDPEELREKLFCSINSLCEQEEEKPKQEIWSNKKEDKRRFYRPTSSSLVYLR